VGSVSGASTPDDVVGDLVVRLSRARDAAAGLSGRQPLGVRAVEPALGRRNYLVAFEGPAFLCLTSDMSAEVDERRARETASAGLLWESVETIVDADALRDLARAIGRLLALGEGPREVSESLETVAARALELAAWREEPVRALASLPDLEGAIGLHERLVGAWARFMRASEPLVEMQETLTPGLVGALREVEEAAGRAGAPERLADRLAGAMPECEEGAEQILAAHVTRLRPEGVR
jgi:hypothetical protein